MVSTIQLKRSATAGTKPTSLADGEIALNYNDDKLYYHDLGGTGSIIYGDLAGAGNRNLIPWHVLVPLETVGFGTTLVAGATHNNNTQFTILNNTNQTFTVTFVDGPILGTKALRFTFSVAPTSGTIYINYWFATGSVALLNGRPAAFSAYFRASVATAAFSEMFGQSFGQGGSAEVDTYGVNNITTAGSGAWERFAGVVTIPSIAGKTIGGNDNLAYYQLQFNPRSATTYDVGCVSLQDGPLTDYIVPEGSSERAKMIDYSTAISVPDVNTLQNAAMEVDQPNVGNALTGIGAAGLYIIDGCMLSLGGGTARFTSQQVADAPAGYRNSIKLSVTTAQASMAATDHYEFELPVEFKTVQRWAWGTANAIPAVCGFWVKANRTGLYGGTIVDWGATYSYVFSFTIQQSGVWQYVSFLIPPPTVANSWGSGNNGSFSLCIVLAAGSSRQATAFQWTATASIRTATGVVNGVAATTDYLQITGVMIYPGNILIPRERAPYLMPRFDDALRFCQRYYEKSYDFETVPGSVTVVGCENWGVNWTTSTASPYFIFEVIFKVYKRSPPTMTAWNPSTGASNSVHDSINNSNLTATWFNQGERAATMEMDNSAASTKNNLIGHWTADCRL